MARFLGTRELGLSIEWRYRFTPPGETAEPVPGVIYLDTGGRLTAGVIDHHGLEECEDSSATLLVQHRELAYGHLLGPVLEERARGERVAGRELPIVVVCHEGPDFDAVVGCLLLRHLIEDGDFPAYAHALAEYARRVDQGLLRLDPMESRALEAIHLAYLALQYGGAGSEVERLSSGAKLERGLRLLQIFLDGVLAERHGLASAQAEDLLPGAPGVGLWRRHPEFVALAETLAAEQARFQADLERSQVHQRVRLPASTGSDEIDVPALIAMEPARSALNRYWARAHGYPLTVYPYAHSAEGGGGTKVHEAGCFPRVIISLDPNYRSTRRAKPSLRGLGYRLEQLETRTRIKTGGGVDERGGPPRFSDGYSESRDPWYDGRGHSYTIVDTPAAGTVLPYEWIVDAVIGGEFWKLPLGRSEVTLIWCSADTSSPSARLAEEQPDELARSLGPYFRDTRETPVRSPELDLEFATGIRLRERFRKFPEGTCPPMRILTLEGERGAYLEDLVGFRDRLVRGRPAEFCYAQIELAPYFGTWESTRELLAALGGGTDLEAVGDVSPGRRLLLFGRQAVILSTTRTSRELPNESVDVIRETLLYAAFLYDSLNVFSQRLGELMPPDRNLLSAASIRGLREDFLRFQSRYYQIEFARGGDSRMLFEKLSAVLGIRELAAEVRSELEQVAALEEQKSEERQARTERTLELLLYLLAVVGGLQTLVNYLGWQGSGARLAFWSAGAVAVATAAYYLLVWRRRRRREQ